MLNNIISFVKSLNTNSNPADIAHGVSIGLLLAILPKNNLLFTFLFFLTFFIRVNKGAFFLCFILAGFVTPFMDFFINSLGFFIIPKDILRPLFLFFENTPFLGLFKLSNTMVAGGLVLGLLLYLPVYFIVKFMVGKYRKLVKSEVSAISGSGLFSKIPVLKHVFKLSGVKDKF